MIYELSGDILLSKASAIAHSVAPNDDFQEGLRLGLRGKWPMLIQEFRKYVRQCQPLPGEIWTWTGPDISIFNLFTLEGERYEGSKATVGNVEHCLRRLRYELDSAKIRSVAMPRLATGQGRLEWSEVLPLIHGNLGDSRTTVLLYSNYHQDVQALEPVA